MKSRAGSSLKRQPKQIMSPVSRRTETPGPTDLPADRRMDAAVDEMRALLDRLGPSSDAEALQALRRAFPSASLSDRIAALSRALHP